MLHYLNDVLGFNVVETPWSDEKLLPIYLRNGRKYTIASFDHFQVLVIYIEPSIFNLAAYQKQKKNLQKYWNGEIILCFEKITSYQRKALIEQKVPFVVPMSQFFFPGYGVACQERISPDKKAITKLSAKAQQLLIYLILYGQQLNINKKELALKLNVSAMSITRAVQELESVGLVGTEKVGRSSLVSSQFLGQELFDKAKTYMIDPVSERVFIRKSRIDDNLLISGESALSKVSMLSSPSVLCRAISKQEYRQRDDLELVDPAWTSESEFIELEVWKYDPAPLSNGKHVDIVSLALSFSGHDDERVQMAVEEMLEEYRW